MSESEPLKILILGQDPDLFARPGGAPNDTRERHLGYVRELLRRRPGSEVRIVVHTRRADRLIFDEPFPGLAIYGTNSRSRIEAPLALFRAVRRFRREGWLPHVISCQSGHEEGMMALAARAKKSRVQIQVHNDFYGDAFAQASLRQRMVRWGTRMAVRRCDHARVVSQGIRRSLIEAGDLTSDRIAVAPVPVVFVGVAPKPDPTAPIVLFVGRLVPQKGLTVWAEVASLVHRRIPAARFWIVGDGPDRSSLAKALEPLGDAVRSFGSVSYGGLAEIYAQASVFLLTSHYEGLGRVVVEAMLAQVPVVSTDIVGPQDLIEDGRTGRLVLSDPQALADATLELLQDHVRASTMARAGRTWAEENYSFAAVTARLVTSWEEAAALPLRRP